VDLVKSGVDRRAVVIVFSHGSGGPGSAALLALSSSEITDKAKVPFTLGIHSRHTLG